MKTKITFLVIASVALMAALTPAADGRTPNPSTVSFENIELPFFASKEAARRGAPEAGAHGTSDNVRKRCLKGRTVVIRFIPNRSSFRRGEFGRQTVGSTKTRRNGDWSADIVYRGGGKYKAILQGRKLFKNRGFCARATDNYILDFD